MSHIGNILFIINIVIVSVKITSQLPKKYPTCTHGREDDLKKKKGRATE